MEDAKKAFVKYVHVGSVADYHAEKSEFHSDTGKVYLNALADLTNLLGKCADYFHEHGHYIDYFSANGDGGYTSMVTPNFKMLIINDFERIIKGMMETNGCIRIEAYEKLNAEFLSYLNIENRVNDALALADICSGLSNNAIKWISWHDSAYWNKHGVERDAFAHMFQAEFFPSQKVLMRKYFPNAFKEFDRLLQEVIA